jgi:isopentenyl-diphosphate delta-isomerase
MTQEDFMLKDECILLDVDDNVVGHDNKYETHIFCPERPRAKLHRAFSVFLFDSSGRLLLQQRAAEKITFPNVWTNTCCSHPLFGYSPTEIDSPSDVASGNTPGVKRAAIRKLDHELGIKASQLNIDRFKFLTRMHYWAADVVTHGPQAPWGEHEIDYILFIQADVDVAPNPEEVQDYKYVTYEELKEMMAPSSGLLWSPWCRIIIERFMEAWWTDLDVTLKTDKLAQHSTIHRFDCSQEHMGGAGSAGPWIEAGNVDVKGDAWLSSVADNGGKAPDTAPLKSFVKKGADKRWSLVEDHVAKKARSGAA